MNIISFDVSIEAGWENSISPYTVTAHHRGGHDTKHSHKTLDEIARQIGYFLEQDAPRLLEKYRQIPSEFRDQVK
jgi:hypothetical protein